ncbi:MAG: DNA-directed RNA polymerase subunit D [Candidatus Micrarchaeota archaeon]
MKVDVIKQNNMEMDFRIIGCNVSFANAIRRTAISEVPTFAVDTILFYENSSSFFDEYLANRICLVPIKTDLRSSEKDEVTFTFDVQGPGTIYSSELKSTDSKIVVANEKIPLLNLMDKQVVRLEAKAKFATTREHAKHQPCFITYKVDRSKKDVFDFHMESFGQLTTKQILNKTVSLLESKCDEFEKGLKNL